MYNMGGFNYVYFQFSYRLNTERFWTQRAYFNPRSPRGLRHEPVLDEVTGITISIHAARVENDLRDLQ